MEIKSEVRGCNSGQLDQTLFIEQEGRCIASLDFSDYRGEVAVQMLRVSPDHQRQGLGTALLRDLQRRYPNTEIDFGSLTDEGSHLVSSLKFATVTDPYLERRFAMLARIKDKIEALQRLPPEEMAKRGSDFNRLYDLEHGLEDQLWDKKAERKIIERALPRLSGHPLYNSMEYQYAIEALKNNKMLATSTQRFWPDGRRRKEDWPGYRESYWMKGISFTRDIRYALDWKDVTFAIDGAKLRQRVRLIPFAWNYHFGSNLTDVNHKREREEFAIFKRTPDDYHRPEEDGGGFDTNRFVNPEGALENLDQYLLGIMVKKSVVDIMGEDRLRPILDHPKFMGIFDTKQLK